MDRPESAPSSTVPEEHLRQTDAFTVRMERDPLLRSTIVAVAVLDRSPDWPRLVERIDRATRLAPTFRQRLVPSPLGVAPPRWIVDPELDLSWHVRRVALPAGGDLDSVLEMARIASGAAFDPARPLWEITLVEGLRGGRAALVVKVHHALTDGIGGIQLAAHVVDAEREPADLGPMPPVPTGATHGPLDGPVEALTFGLGRAARSGAAAVGVTGALLVALRHPVRATVDAASTAASLARLVQPVTTTASPVMTERSLQRHFAHLDVDLDALRAVGRPVGASTNDVFLAAVTGGVRRYHEHHGAPVDALRITLPISLRRDGDPIGGNRLTLARFLVPIGIVDPVERMAAIGEVTRRARNEPSLDHTELVAGVLNLLPAGVVGGMLRHVDLVATNVPGFPEPVYVGGARLEAFYPFAPVLGSAANVALMSYRGVGHIGLSTDSGAIPDPDIFRNCLRAGVDEILALRTRGAAKVDPSPCR